MKASLFGGQLFKETLYTCWAIMSRAHLLTHGVVSARQIGGFKYFIVYCTVVNPIQQIRKPAALF